MKLEQFIIRKFYVIHKILRKWKQILKFSENLHSRNIVRNTSPYYRCGEGESRIDMWLSPMWLHHTSDSMWKNMSVKIIYILLDRISNSHQGLLTVITHWYFWGPTSASQGPSWIIEATFCKSFMQKDFFLRPPLTSLCRCCVCF